MINRAISREIGISSPIQSNPCWSCSGLKMEKTQDTKSCFPSRHLCCHWIFKFLTASLTIPLIIYYDYLCKVQAHGIPLLSSLQRLFRSSKCLSWCLGILLLTWRWWTSPSPLRFWLWHSAMPEALTSESMCPLTAAWKSLHLKCPSQILLCYNR